MTNVADIIFRPSILLISKSLVGNITDKLIPLLQSVGCVATVHSSGRQTPRPDRDSAARQRLRHSVGPNDLARAGGIQAGEVKDGKLEG
jgi:hypothetical protein